MPWLSPFLASGLFIWTAVTLVWILSLVIHDYSIVDILWGLGYIAVYWFVALVWLGALRTPQALAPRQLLLGVLVTIWGLRLSLHIAQRNWGKGEDFRYARWRAKAGASSWWRSCFFAFASGAWWTFLSALLMTFLLLLGSVAAMLERTVKESKLGYETYSSQTNAFFPGLPGGLKR
jgi:steroid 5-alpha reductase family enzyme